MAAFVLSDDTRKVELANDYSLPSDYTKECCSGKKCAGYRGIESKTKSGKICQRWSEQSPHGHENTPIQLVPDPVQKINCNLSYL